MRHRVHSYLAMRTLLKFRKCAEGWFAREWTCWKPCNTAHETTASGKPPTIPRTLCNTASGSKDVVRNEVLFLTSAV